MTENKGVIAKENPPLDAKFMYGLNAEKSLTAVFNFKSALYITAWAEDLLFIIARLAF